MASISSDSKITTLPSNARTSEAAKPSSGEAAKLSTVNPQVPQATAAAATPPISALSGFDPNSSFFPPNLPVGDAPATDARRSPQRTRWIGLAAGVLLLAGGILYYNLQAPREKGSADTPHSARASPGEAGSGAKPLRGTNAVVVDAQQHDAQSRVTHTLPADAAPSASPAPVRTREPAPASASVAKSEAPVAAPTPIHPLPHVTHTHPIAPAPTVDEQEPHRATPAAIGEVKKAECSGPESVLGLCEPLRTDQRK